MKAPSSLLPQIGTHILLQFVLNLSRFNEPNYCCNQNGIFQYGNRFLLWGPAECTEGASVL